MIPHTNPPTNPPDDEHVGSIAAAIGAAIGAAVRVGVVVSRYHREITDALLAGARDAFLRCGGADENFVVAEAPGAFELPLIAQVLADDTSIDAVVALGCVVTGETRHDEYINASVAHALQRIALDTAKPVGFGLLTVATLEQARARRGKGAETMVAVLETVRTIERLCAGDPLPQEFAP